MLFCEMLPFFGASGIERQAKVGERSLIRVRPMVPRAGNLRHPVTQVPTEHVQDIIKVVLKGKRRLSAERCQDLR